MLKIELIRFAAQDVITTSVVEAPQGICYCDNDCGYKPTGGGTGSLNDYTVSELVHSKHAQCTDCKFDIKLGWH